MPFHYTSHIYLDSINPQFGIEYNLYVEADNPSLALTKALETLTKSDCQRHDLQTSFCWPTPGITRAKPHKQPIRRFEWRLHQTSEL